MAQATSLALASARRGGGRARPAHPALALSACDRGLGRPTPLYSAACTPLVQGDGVSYVVWGTSFFLGGFVVGYWWGS